MFTLVVDTFIREILVIGDTTLLNKFYFGRIVGFFLFFSMIFVWIIFNLKPYPLTYKAVIMGFLLIRLFSRVVEYVYFWYEGDSLRS
jgi:hypothetical protein